MPDFPAVEPWMRWEFDRLNVGVVTRPRSLQSLLREDALLETKEGEPYHIDRGTLDRFASACSDAERARLRLPVTIHFSADVGDSAYVIDALAVEILRRLERWGAAYPYREGKTWLPQSLAVDLLLRYGGALQRLML
jgi:uncharacterized protein (UPF0216 family)